MTDLDRLYENYIQKRDQILAKQTSQNLTDHLDAIRPMWQAYETQRQKLLADHPGQRQRKAA